MKVHHLNCGSLREVAPVHDEDGRLKPAPAVCHCLLVETPASGLVLVETGLGTVDIEHPAESLGADWLAFAQPVLDPEETAIRQVRRLGHSPRDVRHIVLTHLHGDHTGGLPDFPHAKVHLREAELAAALAEENRHRFRDAHFRHGPEWVTYAAPGGEPWFGFDAVRELDGLPPEILLVPLGGHTEGHAAVAVDTGDGWLLHAGDAYFYHGELDPRSPHPHPETDVLQAVTEADRPLRLGNLARLQQLARLRSAEVQVISAHDPWEFRRAAVEEVTA
ncbi:MBL fold metallo-hydrolase [Sphaerisporangium fuscum]|uniref:MBL fold metallo-hydrolase n=1 Tax=Sphaerisporangium fuscum TaxID=2835868 RepID=UPI001BDD1368|nr:MBL fold metallo-hydrolase [Sphaerisporangium fuscum]